MLHCRRLGHFLIVALVLGAATACGGGGSTPPGATNGSSASASAGSAPMPSASAVSVPLSSASQNVPVAFGNSITGALSLHATNAPSGANLTIDTAAAAPSVTTQSVRPCPDILTVIVKNSWPFPITFDIDGFTLTVPCAPDGELFGFSLYQVSPVPSTIVALKIGDATASGKKLTFTPQVGQVTLPAKSVWNLTIASEDSTTDVTLPIVPGATTQLTSNVSNVSSNLSFTYSTASGGAPGFGSACFPALVNGVLAKALQGVAIVGTPAYYCHLDPGNYTITFGQLVKFSITSPNADASILGLDGPGATYLCSSDTTPQCNTPAFSLPTIQNAIVGNVRDLQLCVPQKEKADCNGYNGAPAAPSRTTVRYAAGDFSLLVADDPSYKPGTASAPVPWDGLFRITLGGPCALSTAADDDNGDVPPNYSDQGQTGVGPAAEFDITPTGKGTCTITVSEDPRYITNDSNPNAPTGRSASLTMTIN